MMSFNEKDLLQMPTLENKGNKLKRERQSMKKEFVQSSAKGALNNSNADQNSRDCSFVGSPLNATTASHSPSIIGANKW